MLVLWALVLLMAVATEFAFSMKTEVNTTRNYKEDMESYYLARAGMNLAMAEIAKPARFHAIHPTYGWITGNPKISPLAQGNNPQNTTGEAPAQPDFDLVNRNDIPLGNGTLFYTIGDENGKVNINKASRETLIRVLQESGSEIGQNRDIIADSILDWVDADSNHRLNGAEDDYYQSLIPPYRAKNAPLETLDELLRIRGITPAMVYGGEDETGLYRGLEKFFTLYEVSGVNPNTMSEEVLPAVFDDKQVQDILKARNEKGYYNDTQSSHFRVTATGKIEGSAAEHTIEAVIQKTVSGKNTRLLTVYWNDSKFNPQTVVQP